MRIRILLLLLIPVLILAGCRQTDEVSIDDLTIELTINPDPPTMGDATISVTLSDAEGNPIDDATISITGNMSHAGMMPVIAESSETVEGVYEIPFQWTMGGDWVLIVEVALANGETASQEFEFDGVTGDMDMGDSDGMDMNHDDMTIGVSGAYMTLTNNSDEDITLISVSAEGVGMSEIHQTIVENDIARMEHMENGLLITVGESVELRPANYHIMLMQLENDLVEGETLSITLEFDNDTSITLDVPIASESPEDEFSVDSNGLTISAAWTRPTMLANEEMNMDNMDMEATEEMSDMDNMDMEATEEASED